jgi:hypothetical protein
MIGISIGLDGFELVCGDPLGGRRPLNADTVAIMNILTQSHLAT